MANKRILYYPKKYFSSKWPSLAADGNTIVNLPWYPRKIVHFSLVLSPSRPKISMFGGNSFSKKPATKKDSPKQ
jgi:hypothetical protein